MLDGHGELWFSFITFLSQRVIRKKLQTCGWNLHADVMARWLAGRKSLALASCALLWRSSEYLKVWYEHIVISGGVRCFFGWTCWSLRWQWNSSYIQTCIAAIHHVYQNDQIISMNITLAIYDAINSLFFNITRETDFSHMEVISIIKCVPLQAVYNCNPRTSGTDPTPR